MENNLPEQLIDLIHRADLGLDTDHLKPDTPLEDLGIDSLDTANLMLVVEEKYKIKIADFEIPQITSVQALAALIHEKQNSEKQKTPT